MDALVRDPDGASLTPRFRAIVDYAIKLARTPALLTESDLAPMRGAGLSDADVHDVCAVAAYYCFVNRIASGLGIELEHPADDQPLSRS